MKLNETFLLLSSLSIVASSTFINRNGDLDSFRPPKSDPDEGLTIPQLIESRGFQQQRFTVQTTDGYLLNHWRIINPIRGIQYKRPVVFFHGLMGSASEFIINPGGHINETLPDGKVGNNLGFELAKRGYDVWLCNVRGNEYSTGHAWLRTTSRAYWSFSKDEMIKYDLPETLDYIKKYTNATKLAYVGHSQGTHIMFGLLATQAKYNDLIEPYIALAPVGTVKYVETLLRILAQQKYLYKLERAFKRFLKPQWVEELAADFCKGIVSKFCGSLVFLINGGVDSGQVNSTRIPTYLSLIGYGTSTKNIAAWGQNVAAGRFIHYDYGYRGNKYLYGSFRPPEYNMAKITNKHMAFFSSLADNLGDVRDLNILRSTLRVKPAYDYVVPLKSFSHLDFAIGMDVGFYVYEKVIQFLDNYEDVMRYDV